MRYKQKIIFLMPLLIFLSLSFFLLKSLNNDPSVLPSALIGQPLPAFNLPTLSSRPARLTEKAFLGKPALINVWATWCPTCVVEHAMLMRLAQSGVIIYGVNYRDVKIDAQHYLNLKGNPFQQVVLDTQGQLSLDLGTYGTPETFVINAQGNILYRHVGEITADVWQRTLKPLLAEGIKNK